MTTRDELRQMGAAMREGIGFVPHPANGPPAEDLAPGFDRFTTEAAFGGLWARPGLGLQERMIATLAALSARQYLPQFRDYVGSALTVGLAPRAIQEISIQAGLYAGFPSAENALRVAQEVFDARGIDLPDVDLPEGDPADLEAMGREVLSALHGARGQQGYASPDNPTTGALYQMAIQYGYGELWNRPGLDRRERMIVALAAFTALDYHAQFGKFVQSAINIGLTRAEAVEVIMQTAPYSGFPRALNALAIADEMLD